MEVLQKVYFEGDNGDKSAKGNNKADRSKEGSEGDIDDQGQCAAGSGHQCSQLEAFKRPLFAIRAETLSGQSG